MQRCAIIIPMALLAAACSTPGDLRATAPGLAFDAAGAPADVVSCLAARWDETSWGAYVAQRLDGERHTIMVHDEVTTGVVFMADVEPAGAGSRITFYDQSSYWAKSRIRAAVQSCAEQ